MSWEKQAVYAYHGKIKGKYKVLWRRVRYATGEPYPKHKKIMPQYVPDPIHRPNCWLQKFPYHLRTERHLYRWPEVAVAIENAPTPSNQGRPELSGPANNCIYWTEGERNSDDLAGLGVVATSHHQGAGKATIQQARRFRGYAGYVVVVADNDVPGAICALRRRAKLLDKAGAALRPGQVLLARSCAGNDLSDALSRSPSAWPLERYPLRELKARAREAPTPQQRQAAMRAAGYDPADWPTGSDWKFTTSVEQKGSAPTKKRSRNATNEVRRR